jgi:TonB-dependent SusC/RagA subfamily outer membrane receptor
LTSRILVIAFVVALCLSVGATAVAQVSGTIVGEVRDADTEQPLVGAQVYVPGTPVGTVTDGSGRFRLASVPAGMTVLRVQLLGYRTGEARIVVAAGRTSTQAFALQWEFLNLDAIVVTGTGAGAREREVAYSVGRIAPSEVSEPVSTVDQLLTGRLPGVTVQQGSGLAGSGSQIRLRGNVSVALGNEPLVYVDGIRVRSEGYPRNVPRLGDGFSGPNDTASPLNDLNPADIERIEIVRGPAATTLYGSEAASGVIQIFTKRGVAGPPVWSAQIDQGWDRVLEFGTERSPYLGLDDWLDDAWRQRYAVSVSGGRALRYYLSTGFNRSSGLLPNDEENRFVVRANLDADPTPSLSIRLSTSHTEHGIRNTSAGINSNSLVLNVLRGPTNALGDTTRQAIDQLLEFDIETDIDHSVLSLTATHVTTPSLTNRIALGYDRAAGRFWQLRPVGYVLAPDGILWDEDWVSQILTAEYGGSLNLVLPRELTSTLSWGAQSVTSDVRTAAGYAEGFSADREPTIESGDLSLRVDSRTRVRTSGLFAEEILGYRERYFAIGGIRVDGSTAFGDDLDLQVYPRVGASYVVSEEPFWSPSWGRLKLRAVYGHAGRAPEVVDKLRTWRESDFDGEIAYVPGAVGNPELAPERTSELEVGFDGSFLAGRLTADFTWYDQKTTDALFPVAQIPSSGFLEDQLKNVGTLRNEGLELSLSGLLVARSSFGLEAGFYLYTNHSELTDLGGAPPLNVDDGAWILEGEPAPVLRGAVVRNADEVAEPVLELNQVFGPNLPTHTLGFSSTVRLPREVELFARAEYSGGHYLYDNTGNHLARRNRYAPCAGAYDMLAAGNRDGLTAWERVWCIAANVPPGQGPIYPADFFRFRELTLTKELSPGLLKGWRSTLVVSLRNFWTWKNDDFLVFDPEMSGREGMHARSRMIDAEIPTPASIVVSLRVDQ